MKRPTEIESESQDEDALHPADLTHPGGVERLLATARKIYDKTKRAEKTLLDDRIEIGRILLRLKALVGHGGFIKSVIDWESRGLLNFGLKTAERAMAYADLHAQGKLDSVSNLAEAEGIRKAGMAKNKKAESDAKTDDDNDPQPSSSGKLKLPTKKARQRAQILSQTALDECREYEAETKRLVIEELIEILTTELERCTE